MERADPGLQNLATPKSDFDPRDYGEVFEHFQVHFPDSECVAPTSEIVETP